MPLLWWRHRLRQIRTTKERKATTQTMRMRMLLTDEYMHELERRIDNMMQRYELYRNPQDKMFLDCMVRDYESKMKLKLKEYG